MSTNHESENISLLLLKRIECFKFYLDALIKRYQLEDAKHIKVRPEITGDDFCMSFILNDCFKGGSPDHLVRIQHKISKIRRVYFQLRIREIGKRLKFQFPFFRTVPKNLNS